MSIAKEVETLRSKGFTYAATFLENPVLVDGLRLHDILALHDEGINDDTITITVQAANQLRGLVDAQKPLSYEDAYFIGSINEKNQLRFNKQVGLFHQTYFLTPFPEERASGDFYALPTRLIKHIATQKDTKEHIDFAEQIMRRLVLFYNTELYRWHFYYNKVWKAHYKEKTAEEERELKKCAQEIQLDLTGYNGMFFHFGEKPEPYPSDKYDYDMQHAGHYWIRPLFGTHLDGPEYIADLGRMSDNPFAKKLSRLFRDIVKENPLEYFEPPYMKELFEEPLE